MRWSIDTTETGIKAVRLRAKGQPVSSHHRDEGRLARRWRATTRKELRAYLAGRLRLFSAPCDLSDLPPFTQAVLKITAQIPYGEVRSYRWVAARVGKPRASRAVGNALARNPIPLVIPCHRVVRCDGSLGGFALGRDWKKKLLMLEKSSL
ncbi:MAG: methylated-DNA--[protein]-cysteine S-methyltransferase [Candidatus Binatia bacterium]